MDANFRQPDEKEFDHHTSVMARIATLKPLPPALPLPLVVAMALVCYGRTPHNVKLQWEIDRDSVVSDSLTMFQRHIEIIHWTFENAQPDKLDSLHEIIPPGDVAVYEAALAKPEELRQSLTNQFGKFIDFVTRKRPNDDD